MSSNVCRIDSPVNPRTTQPTEGARRIVPTMPLIINRIVYKFERSVRIDSIRREFECSGEFVESLIRRELRSLRAENTQLRRKVAA